MTLSSIVLFSAILLIHEFSLKIHGYDRLLLQNYHEPLVSSRRLYSNSINASSQPPLLIPPVVPPASSNDSNSNHWTPAKICIVAAAGVVIPLACCIGAMFNGRRSGDNEDRLQSKRSNLNPVSQAEPPDQHRPQDLPVVKPRVVPDARKVVPIPPKIPATPGQKNEEPLPPPVPTEPYPGLKKYTLNRLKTATSDFSAKNILGKGAFGEVYRGTIMNKTVAIKKLLCENTAGADEDFKTELHAISKVHHRNLITLLGYCISGPMRLLVYEFAANNSLAHHIRPGLREKLSWATRMKIILETAKALMYLHHDCKPGIVHRDIKTANILLDSEFEAKVADFGLAKFYPDSFATHISSLPKGTLGYIDPHYSTSWKLNYKSDVYSFGILVLVLITGYEPSVALERAKLRLKSGVINKNFDGIADELLDKNYDHDQMTRIIACAAVSISPLQEDRPTMKQIVHVLEGASSPTGFLRQYLKLQACNR